MLPTRCMGSSHDVANNFSVLCIGVASVAKNTSNTISAGIRPIYQDGFLIIECRMESVGVLSNRVLSGSLQRSKPEILMTESTENNRQRMGCMEIWGGNRAIAKSFEAPGLDIHVHSQPFQDNEVGGDIYYLTSCASGRISRFLLADVSGHGSAASGLARSLRDLMRQNVNRISQDQFVSGMNREFGTLAEDSGFATAVVATFFEPTQTLDISVAGHPHPFYYRADRKQWFHLDPASSDSNFENMPLGVVEASIYPRRKVNTKSGDMFLLYTDAFIESAINNQSDAPLGMDGVVELLNESPGLAPSEVIPYMRNRIGAMAPGNLVEDDASLILGHFTKTKVRLKDNLLAPIRLLGGVGDRTKLEKLSSE